MSLDLAILANATTCLDVVLLSFINAFATLHFTFKIASKPNATPPMPTDNPFVVMRRAQVLFVSVPPRLSHERMYANHHLYNDLIALLEMHELEWTIDNVFTDRKRFVDVMSKAFFQCTLATWNALNDKHNNDEFF